MIYEYIFFNIYFKMIEVGLKIKKLREFKKLTQIEFCEKIGIKQANLSHMENKGAKISVEIIQKIISYFNINANWLLTNVGSMLKSEDVERSTNGIPLIPIEAMAGFGEGETNIMEYDCERYDIPLFKGADFLISVKGSSMYPKYSSGDVVACKKLPVDTFFQWNKVYVLDTVQGALIKRIKRGCDDEHLLIVSENDRYEPFELHRSEVHSVALVIGVIRLE